MIAGPEGFSIASGCVSVFGLGVSAFAAAAIWQLRFRYVRIIRLRELLRRLEWVRTETNRARIGKQHHTLRDVLGRLPAILIEVKLQSDGRDDIEWLLERIAEIERSDNRSLERLVREMLPRLSRVIERLELVVHGQETGVSDASG